MQPPPLPPPLPPANPYAAPVARLAEADTGEMVLADRGIRLVAAIVDSLVLAVPAIVVAVLGAQFLDNAADSDTIFAVIGGVAFVSIGAGLVVNLVLLHRNGQTIAKRLFGIRIVRRDGGRCSVLRVVFMRWLPVTLLGMIPILGYAVSLLDALMIFGTEQRCLHDYIADTIVVKA
jgi:uncharacterized RDD family membrane protein YckC